MATKLCGNWACNNNGATLTISWEHHYINFIQTSFLSITYFNRACELETNFITKAATLGNSDSLASSKAVNP